jgi:hypothetical protein
MHPTRKWDVGQDQLTTYLEAISRDDILDGSCSDETHEKADLWVGTLNPIDYRLGLVGVYSVLINP